MRTTPKTPTEIIEMIHGAMAWPPLPPHDRTTSSGTVRDEAGYPIPCDTVLMCSTCTSYARDSAAVARLDRAAIAAVVAGDLDDALANVEVARAVEGEWGDDASHRMIVDALETLRDAPTVVAWYEEGSPISQPTVATVANADDFPRGYREATRRGSGLTEDAAIAAAREDWLAWERLSHADALADDS